MAKGPYKARETLTGSKCLSTSRPNLTNQGKMSSAHGVVPSGPTKGMRHPEGRIGAGTRGFKSNLSSTTGGIKGGPKHASQPSGHKSKS